MTDPIVLRPFTLDDFRRSVDDLYRQAHHGCGNHGCCINPVIGQGTNAGCQCYPHIIARDLRRLAEAIERSGRIWAKETEKNL